jgi:hypothetical protein
MASLEIRRSRNAVLWGVLIPPLGLVAFAFSSSIRAGLVVLLLAAACLVFFAPLLKHRVDHPPVALILDENGLSIPRGLSKNACIPWNDIEETALSSGGRGGTVLNLRFRQPEKYLGRFMRANRALSRFHMTIPVGDLECSPAMVAKKIEEARRLYA